MKPSSSRFPTACVSESTTRGPAGTRTARNVLPEDKAVTNRIPSSLLVPSTTAMDLALVVPPTRSGSTNTAANSTGSTIAEIQNQRLRTRSTNSRRMTAASLCTGQIGLFADQIDEDFVQRRLHQLEAREPCARVHEFTQQLLGIGSRKELHLSVLPVVVHLAREARLTEQLGSVA